MRERLTAAFVLLAIAVLIGAGAVRSFTLLDLLREDTSLRLGQHAELTARLIAERQELGEQVTGRYLESLAPVDSRIEYVDPNGAMVVAEGAEFGDSHPTDLSASTTTEVGTVTVSEPSAGLGDILGREPTLLFTLLLLISFLAGLLGYLAARALSQPLEKLAVAASALGRGRFDLDLPRTRIPEARAIGTALRTSAVQLESRLRRERSFSEQASHELRTPLTSLRLELEDLVQRRDVPTDVHASASRCLASVDEMSASAGRLVELTRGSLVEGAEVPLQELCTELAQRWADRLRDRRRKLTARVEGDLDLLFTPGPVEQVLDLVLADVLLGGSGPVRITFFAEDRYLRVRMPAGVIAEGASTRRFRRGAQPGSGLASAREVAAAIGGKVTGDGVTEDLEVLLPRR
jgi:signal transduction histidine kinase